MTGTTQGVGAVPAVATLPSAHPIPFRIVAIRTILTILQETNIPGVEGL